MNQSSQRTLSKLRSRAALWLALLPLLALGVHGARARTLSARLGAQTSATSPGAICFRFHSANGDVGIQKANNTAGGCDPAFYTIPIVWDNNSAAGTSRTVRVVGKRGGSSGFLTCQALNYFGTGSSAGQLASQSSTLSITTDTTYSGINLVLNNVPAGSFGFVLCNLSPNSAIIQGIDYAQ